MTESCKLFSITLWQTVQLFVANSAASCVCCLQSLATRRDASWYCSLYFHLAVSMLEICLKLNVIQS